MTIRARQGTYAVRFVSLPEAIADLPSRRVIVTDDNVRSAWGAALEGEASVLSVPPGEASKSLREFGRCLSGLAGVGADRGTTVVALGGGVVGDLAGFVAASYMRGVPFVQIPTSLLAMVDSSVGGKVGIDLPEGKNLAGAFYPPRGVYVPLETLATLPPRHLRNGMAEVWKYGFVLDADFARLLFRDPLTEGSPRWEDVVRRCIELKAQVVEEDEMETTGRRAILNFGHTVGHAIEAATGYGPILHGEAIAIGMAVEARLGERLGVTEPGVADFVASALSSQGLPVTDPILRRADVLLGAMRKDKKARSGALAFSLLTKLGECKLREDVPECEVRLALASP